MRRHAVGSALEQHRFRADSVEPQPVCSLLQKRLACLGEARRDIPDVDLGSGQAAARPGGLNDMQQGHGGIAQARQCRCVVKRQKRRRATGQWHGQS